MSFLNVKIIRQDKTFTIYVYRKPILSGVYTHFESFLPSTYKISKNLTSGVVYKFQCALCNKSYCAECVRYLNVRIGEQIGISPLTKKRDKPMNSTVADHLLFYNHPASYHNFDIRTYQNEKVLLKLKEGLLITIPKPTLDGIEHLYISTKIPIRQALTIRSFLEFYLVLIVVTLFLLNGVFIIQSCLSV